MTDLDIKALEFIDKRSEWDGSSGNRHRWRTLSFELDYLLRPEGFVIDS